MNSLTATIIKNNKEKIPLGTILIADELILPQDLHFALDHQQHSRQLLGEILVRMGALEMNDLDEALKLQSGALSH